MASSSHYFAAVAAATTREVEQIIKEKETNVEGRLNEVYASAGTPSSLDPGLQELQAHSLDVLRKDDWT